MAEYASAIVGLIAVGAHVNHKTYQAVKSFKHAQAEFLALSNEITEFCLILKAVETALSGDSLPQAAVAEVDLANLLQQSHETINEVSALLSETQAVGDTEITANRRKWLVKARRAKSLQEKVKGHRLFLLGIIQAHML
ncbi:hypothetical protein QQX98_011884 [Neonectria punicea]|uniref:Fungal N-terminal domain-containing protein n=1 Tax=Neonectria punicea TaxID=979145 RepID=A0ABR1GKJ9_9HYPO